MSLDALVVIAIAFEVSKGIELMLRKEQREAVQKFLEDLTLRVSYIDIKDVGKNIGNPEIQAVFTMITTWQFALVSAVALGVQRATEQYPKQVFVLQLVCLAVSAVTLLFAWRWPLPSLIRWVVGDGRKWTIRRRTYGFLLGGYVVLIIGSFGSFWVMASFEGALKHLGLTDDAVFMITLLPMWPCFTILWIVFQGGGLLLQLHSRIGRFFVSKYLALFRWLLWRIVEWEKGSVAALVLLIGIALAVAKILFGK